MEDKPNKTLNARKQPRQKAWNPKVKTGCSTCKQRKVKCDESKPHCIRCTNAKVVCDGYVEPPKAWIFEHQSDPELPQSNVPGQPVLQLTSSPASATTQCGSQTPKSRLQCNTCAAFGYDVCRCVARAYQARKPKLRAGSLTSLLRPCGPYKTTAEQFYLKYFTEVIATQLARSGISISFWQSSFPQAAWTDNTTRNALLSSAISYRHMQNLPRACKSPAIAINPLAMGYENRAIHSLVAERPPVDAMLLSSVAFWLNAMVFGDWEKGLQHAYHALKLCTSINDRSEHDPIVVNYVEGLARCSLGYHRHTQGPCQTHLRQGQDLEQNLLACEATCYRLEDTTIEERLGDSLHHLEPVSAAMIDFRQLLTARQIRHTEHDRILDVLTKTAIEAAKLRVRWSDFSGMGLDPDKMAKAQAEAPYTNSPFTPIFRDLNDYIEKDKESRFSFGEIQMRLRIIIPIISVSTGGKDPGQGMENLTLILSKLNEGM